MTKSPPAIRVPTIAFRINSTVKPDMRDTAVSIEKSKFYFGSNWKLPFSALSETSVTDIQAILQQDQQEEVLSSNSDIDISFLLETEDQSKAFEIIFSSHKVSHSQFLRQKQEIFRFLQKFIKLYDKWAYKEDAKLRQQQEDEKERVSYANSKKAFGSSRVSYGKSPRRQVYGKRATSTSAGNRTSRFFANDDEHGVQDDPERTSSIRAPVQKIRPTYKSKVQKLKDKILAKELQRGYYSSDEEDMRAFKRDPEPQFKTEADAEADVDGQVKGHDLEPDVEESAADMDVDMNVEEQGLEETDDNHVPMMKKEPGTKRAFVSMGSRLKKKVRIDDDEDDSDLEFDSQPLRANAVRTRDTVDIFHEDDDDGNDNATDDKQQITHLATRTKAKPAHITPPRTATATQNAKKEEEPIDDAVTDEEEFEDPRSMSPLAKESKSGGIQSFFTTQKTSILSLTTKKMESTIASNDIFDVDEDESQLNQDTSASELGRGREREPRKLLKPSKFVQRKRQAYGGRTLADAALDDTSPKKLVGPLKLGANLNSHSPQKSLVSSSPSRSQLSPVKNPYAKSATSTATSSASKKQYLHHVGLTNVGNTCYLNSSLQILFSVPDFLDDLKETYDKLNTIEIENDKKSLPLPLCFALLTVASRVRVIQPLIQSDATRDGPAYPSILKKQMDVLTDKFAGYEQRDAHEFLSDLIDFLHDELANAKNVNGENMELELPTDKYFRLDVDVCLTCNSCKYSRSKEELYRHLSVEVGTNQNQEGEEEQWSIDEGLQRFFQPEVRDIQCEKCEEGKSVTQTMTIKSRPKALLVHLKRFIVHMNKGEMTFQKSKTRVKSENSVSLETFTEEAAKRGDTYELKGVVRHIGNTSNSGHYTADALRKQENGDGNEWVYFDDSSSSKTSIESILDNGKSQRNNYLMLYGRL